LARRDTFRSEARQVLGKLEQRIAREDGELYPLLAQLA